ncbi:MAG: hypothetical protein ACRDPE_16775 [Solirubrobacterales bacterium]
MDAEQSHQRSEAVQRSVESAVLAIVIEAQPQSLSRRDLFEEMVTTGDDPQQVTEVQAAIDGLASAGLLSATADRLSPTPAALRAAELDLGI